MVRIREGGYDCGPVRTQTFVFPGFIYFVIFCVKDYISGYNHIITKNHKGSITSQLYPNLYPINLYI